MSTSNTPAQPDKVRTGRNLPMATAVGIGLLLVLEASLAFHPLPFVFLVLVAVLVALWELCGAVKGAGFDTAYVPLATGSAATLFLAYYADLLGVFVGVALTMVAAVIWRAFEGYPRYLARDIAASVFLVLYVPLLASFTILIATRNRWEVLLLVLLAVGNDLGGYAAGVLFGKHKLAPVVSPKKTWEGLAGSLVLSMIIGGVGLFLTSGSWWLGVILGALAVGFATVGDLGESLIKRDVGIKDLGSILPGHGGVMDRVDSILAVAPLAFLVLVVV